MVTIEEVRDLKEKIRKNLGLVMSRVPEKTRAEFIEFANGEFAEDYGMCLHYIWECFKHYQQVLNTQDTKLDYMITLLKNIQSPKIEALKMPKMLGSTEREVRKE